MELIEGEKYILTNLNGEALSYRMIIKFKIPLVFVKITKQGLAYMWVQETKEYITVKRKSLVKIG